MARQSTRLESEGAEFLVLGQMLISGIDANKRYRNSPDYDITASCSSKKRVATISVKSRWKTNAEGFINKNCNCDFVVVVKLNRGSKDGRAEVKYPEFYVLPSKILASVQQGSWNKVAFSKIPNLDSYKDNWTQISGFLER